MIVSLLLLVFLALTVEASDHGLQSPRDAGNPAELDVDQLGPWMERYLNGRDAPAESRLRALLEYWNFEPRKDDARRISDVRLPTLPVVKTDLDGDGQPELVASVSIDDGSPLDCTHHHGALYVVTQKDGRYRVTVSYPTDDPGVGCSGDFPGVAIAAVADISDDGRPEVISYVTQCGAHTCAIDIFASAWSGSRLDRLPGSGSAVTPTRLEVIGGELVTAGGAVGSVGAGRTRTHTDRYRVKNGELRLVRRAFAPSSLAYDRLIDGIEAESWGRTDEALEAYREAADPLRPATTSDDLCPPSGHEAMAEFAAAVRQFARFRAGALLVDKGDEAALKELLASAANEPFAGLGRSLLGARDRKGACHAVAAWARDNTAWLAALNTRCGYAKPYWRPNDQDLCGGLPNAE